MQKSELLQGGLFNYQHRWSAMTILLIANFMVFLDVNIVNVALPSLQKTLNANETSLQWIVTIYVLVYALALLPLGRMGDVLGRKRLFMSGVAAFTLASLFCGLTFNVSTLIFFRALQAIAAAMITPQVMAIAQSMFAPNERAKAFSWFGVISGVAAITGPIASGFLIKLNLFDFGWRSIFYINIPIGIVLPVFAILRIPNFAISHGGNRGTDWTGVILVALALLSLIFPIIEGQKYHWAWWTFAMMSMFPILSIAFVIHSSLQAKKNRPVLLPLHIIFNHDYLIGTFGVMVYFSALLGFLLVFVLFLQQGLNFSPFNTGLTTASFPIGILIATVTLIKLVHPKARLLLGASLSIISAIILWKISGDPQLTITHFILPLLLGGLGSGIIIASLFQSVMKTVPLKDAGAGAGALQALQQVGGAVGIALVSQIFFSNIAKYVNTDLSNHQVFTIAFQNTIFYYLIAYIIIFVIAFAMKFEIPDYVLAANEALMGKKREQIN